MSLQDAYHEAGDGGKSYGYMMKMALWRNKRYELGGRLVSDVTPFSLYPCLYFLRKEMQRYKGKS